MLIITNKTLVSFYSTMILQEYFFSVFTCLHYIVKRLFCFIQNVKIKVNLEGFVLSVQVNLITFWTLMDSDVSVKVMKN